MKLVVLQIGLCFLFVTIINAQDTDKLFKYFELVGQSVSSLDSSWGLPIKEEINDYGVIVYHFKEGNGEYEFSFCDQTVIGAIMKLQPGQDDASSFTFYMIFGLKLEEEGFERVETTYDANNISVDERTHNFAKEYEIRDKFKKGNLIIRMSLTRNENFKLTLKSAAVFNNKN